jgi:ribosomal protein S27AE
MPTPHANYEDNFGFYDLDADETEAAFLAFVKSQSRPRKCRRCGETVLLQPDRYTCARCAEAIEFGGESA